MQAASQVSPVNGHVSHCCSSGLSEGDSSEGPHLIHSTCLPVCCAAAYTSRPANSM